MTLTVRANLTKWEHTKCMGETPKAFIERMTRNIEAVKKNGLAELKEMYKNVSSVQTKEYYENQIKYQERKLNRWLKEIKKAQAELN